MVLADNTGVVKVVDLVVPLSTRAMVAAASANQSTVEPEVVVEDVKVSVPSPQRDLDAELGTVAVVGTVLMVAMTAVLVVEAQPVVGSNAEAK